MTEQLRGDQGNGNCGAVDADERIRRALRSLVDRASDQLLACPCLAQDQHCRIGRRDFHDFREDRLNRRRRADDLFEHELAVDLLAQRDVFFVKPVLEPLQILDVCQQRVPADNPPLFVPSRNCGCVKPAINAVGAAKAVLIGVILPRLRRMLPLPDHFGQLVGMHDVAGCPALDFLDRNSEVLEKLSIHEFDFAFRSRRKNETGNAVDDQTKTLFAGSQRRLRALAVVNVGCRHVPFRLAQRAAAEQEPAIDTVGAAEARFDFERRSSNCPILRSKSAPGSCRRGDGVRCASRTRPS